MYKDINITRHSKLNLDINEEFIRLLIKNNVLHFKALRKNGCIDGFFAYFCQQSLMISPLVGYNKSLPKEANLYRCLSTLLILEAQQRQVVLHLGAGPLILNKTVKRRDTWNTWRSITGIYLLSEGFLGFY